MVEDLDLPPPAGGSNNNNPQQNHPHKQSYCRAWYRGLTNDWIQYMTSLSMAPYSGLQMQAWYHVRVGSFLLALSARPGPGGSLPQGPRPPNHLPHIQHQDQAEHPGPAYSSQLGLATSIIMEGAVNLMNNVHMIMYYFQRTQDPRW